MSDETETPEDYYLTRVGRRWYVSKNQNRLRQSLLTKKRQEKWFRSEVSARRYCWKHKRQGLSSREEAK